MPNSCPRAECVEVSTCPGVPSDNMCDVTGTCAVVRIIALAQRKKGAPHQIARVSVVVSGSGTP